ncbi:MAG: transporter, partial [Terracidiphilus sp.]
MQTAHTLRNRLFGLALLTALLAGAPAPARATSKEIIELQTQVQQLLDMVQRLQSTMDTRFGVLQHLAEQTADESNRVTASVNAMQQRLNQQSEATGAKLDAASGQVQSLNDSVDEVKSRLAKLDKTLQDLNAQLQAMQQQGTQPTTPAPQGGT